MELVAMIPLMLLVIHSQYRIYRQLMGLKHDIARTECIIAEISVLLKNSEKKEATKSKTSNKFDNQKRIVEQNRRLTENGN